MFFKQKKFLQILTPETLVLYKYRTMYTKIINKPLNPFIKTVLLSNYKTKTKVKGFITLNHNSLLKILQKKLFICDVGITHFFLYNNFSNNISFLFTFSQVKVFAIDLQVPLQEETKKLNLKKQLCKSTSFFFKQPLCVKLTTNQHIYQNNKISQLANKKKTSKFIKFTGFFPLRQKTRVRPLKPCLAIQSTDFLPFNNTTSLLVNKIYWTFLAKTLNILQKSTTFQNKFLSFLINNMFIGELRNTKYQLQKQSVKYKKPLRNTCKLLIIYVFGSFCWLYFINYSPKKEKLTENSLPEVVLLFQQIVINNLPLFQKNYQFYTKETSENLIIKQQNKSFSKLLYSLKTKDIKNYPHKFFQVLEDQGNKQRSLFFNEIFLQNYVGRLNNRQNHKGTKDSEFIFFARKSFSSMPLLAKSLKSNIHYFAGKHYTKFPFIGPEFDFLPRHLDWIDNKNRFTSILKEKNNWHKFNVTFKPNLLLAEQVQLFNYFNQPHTTLQVGLPSLNFFKTPSFSTYGVITNKKHSNYVNNLHVLGSSPASAKLISVKGEKKYEKKKQSYLVRTLLCEKKLILNKTNYFIDNLSKGRLQSGFNFPDAPVLYNRSFLLASQAQDKKLINKKNRNTISIKSNNPTVSLSSFFIDINVVPQIFGETMSNCTNKKKILSVGLLKYRDKKSSFLELVYKPKLLQGFISYDQKGGYIHYKKKNYSSSNNFFESVKSIINKIPPVTSQIIGLKAWANRTYPFVNLDKHADIKIYKSYLVKQSHLHQNKVFFVQPFRTNTDNFINSNVSSAITATMAKKSIHNDYQHIYRHKTGLNNKLRRMYAPESFFGTSFLQLGERFTVDYLNGKNQMGLIFNVHTGALMTPILKPIWPYASTGTSLNTVFGKKQLTTARAKKPQSPITSGRLVSQWFISNAPYSGREGLRNKFSENSFFYKNNGTFLNFKELPWNKLHTPKALLRRLFSVKTISGKSNRYTINPFMYYNPGTKRDRNIEDTMLTLEGFKKSRLFPNTHTNFRGISLPLTTTKVLENFSVLSDPGWALYDPDLQSILGGMRQRTESRRVAQNVTGAPTSNIDELQKNLNQRPSKSTSLNNYNKGLLTEQEQGHELKVYSKEQKRKKFNSTNCYPLRTQLTVCSYKPLSHLENSDHVMGPTDQTEYIFYDYNPSFFFGAPYAQVSTLFNTNNYEQIKYTHTKSTPVVKNFFLGGTQLFTNFNPSQIYQQNKKCYVISSTKIKGGSGITKGLYLENIFYPIVYVKNKGLSNQKQEDQHYGGNLHTVFASPLGLIFKAITDFNFNFFPTFSLRNTSAVINTLTLGFCSTNITFNFSKILFITASWFSYKFLATPLARSTQLLPAAFTEAVGLQSFQQKYRIIAANKTTQSFKNLAGAEKTLSELRDLIWTFRLVGTGGPRGEHSPLSCFPYIGGQAGQERSSIFSKARNRFLLVGPPGTGKTLLVKALAAEANVPVIVQPVSQLRMIAGVENPISALFHVARQIKPCIIFLDELDTLGNNLQTSINATTAEQKLGIRLARKYTYTLLLELDGLTSSTRDLLIIGATNRPETLNPALIRSGRFETFINCDLPSQEQRIAVLSLYLANFCQNTKKYYQQGGASKLLTSKVTLASQSSNYSVHLPEANYSLNSTLNLQDFYIKYVASQCSGLSQASISAVVNQSALDSMLHSYSPALHTLKTLERAVESVKTLTPQAFTGASKRESDFDNQTIFSFLGNNKNNLQNPIISNGKNNQTQFSLIAKSAFVNKRTLGIKPGASYKKETISSDNQRLSRSSFHFISGKPKSQPLILLRKTTSINPLLFSSTKKQNIQFLVYRAYQTASSPIFFYKNQNWDYFNPRLNRLFFNEVSEKNSFQAGKLETKQKHSTPATLDFFPKDKQLLDKNSLEKGVLKSYAQQAAICLYSATRPQNFKLFDKFGLCHMESMVREINLLGLKKLWCNGSGLKAIEESFLGKSNNTYTDKKNFSQSVNPLQNQLNPYKSFSTTTKNIELLNSSKNFCSVLSNIDYNGFPETKQGQNSNIQQKNSFGSYLTSTAFVREKNNLAYQVKTNNPLTTGWFRMYLSRPLIKYDSLSYIENKEYYPQNYYVLKQGFARSLYLRNVSTLSHFSGNSNLNKDNFNGSKIKNLGPFWGNYKGKYTLNTTKGLNFAISSKFCTTFMSQRAAMQDRAVSSSPGFVFSPEVHNFKASYEVPTDQFFYGIGGKRNKQHHLLTPILEEQINHTNVEHSSKSLEFYFNKQFQPIYLTIIAYFFHKACYLYKENRELLDYCVYNKLRYSALYVFSVKQVCNKF